MPVQMKHSAMAHVRFEGRSLDVPLVELGIAGAACEQEIRSALAGHLQVPEERLRDYILDRHATGNITLRPEAVFG
jgi:hypothetical protein